MKKITSLFILTIILLSCNNKNNSSNSVSGTVFNLEKGTMIYLDFIPEMDITTIDSTTLDGNGNYSFKAPITETGFYRLRINNQNFINLVLENDATPVIKGDGNNLMDTYSIEGSIESQRLKEFNLAYKINAMIQDSLVMVYQANRNDPTILSSLQPAKFSAINNMNIKFMQLINDNPGSLVSLAAVQQLDPKAKFEYYEKVDQALMKEIPNSVHTKKFHKMIEKMINLSIGDEAPEITLNDIEGNPTSLSSLRGKVVLLDFWASWCRPCRFENPNVVKAYHKYKNKGFDVFSVSLDGMPQQQNAKQNWLDAIKKDGLIWDNHVSDLNGWKSSIVPIYGIESIPYTLLIDEEGIIIGKNLRGNQLENKLEEIFE